MSAQNFLFIALLLYARLTTAGTSSDLPAVSDQLTVMPSVPPPLCKNEPALAPDTPMDRPQWQFVNDSRLVPVNKHVYLNTSIQVAANVTPSVPLSCKLFYPKMLSFPEPRFFTGVMVYVNATIENETQNEIFDGDFVTIQVEKHDVSLARATEWQVSERRAYGDPYLFVNATDEHVAKFVSKKLSKMNGDSTLLEAAHKFLFNLNVKGKGTLSITSIDMYLFLSNDFIASKPMPTQHPSPHETPQLSSKKPTTTKSDKPTTTTTTAATTTTTTTTTVAKVTKIRRTEHQTAPVITTMRKQTTVVESTTPKAATQRTKDTETPDVVVYTADKKNIDKSSDTVVLLVVASFMAGIVCAAFFWTILRKANKRPMAWNKD